MLTEESLGKNRKKKKKGFDVLFVKTLRSEKDCEFKKEKKHSMHGIIVAAGTKDKMDPSMSAATNCQLRIRSSRQACLNKPVNMALLTPRDGAQAKCCLLLFPRWRRIDFTPLDNFLSSEATSERRRDLTYHAGDRTASSRLPARLQQSRWTWEPLPPCVCSLEEVRHKL